MHTESVKTVQRNFKHQYGNETPIITIPNWLNSFKETSNILKAKSPCRTRTSEAKVEKGPLFVYLEPKKCSLQLGLSKVYDITR